MYDREMLNFDRVEVWGPQLSQAIKALVPASVTSRLPSMAMQYIDDAFDNLVDHLGVDRMKLSAAVEAWLSDRQIAGFHGSRLTNDETVRVRAEGLRLLTAGDRRERLAQVLSVHPDWGNAGSKLEAALEDHGLSLQLRFDVSTFGGGLMSPSPA